MSEQLDNIERQIGDRAETGAQILDDAHRFIGRFCVFPNEHCHAAVTLWAAMTHSIEYFHIAPRLALISAEPESGKTRVLEILNLLVAEPMAVLNASPAPIFRTLAERMVTLLFDEVDSLWKNGDDSREDLRSLLNSGYKRGAEIPRCTGKKFEVEMFPVFCPVALAGIGEPPETILSRSIVVKMQRRAPGEKVDQFRSRMHETPGHALRNRLQAWMGETGEAVGNAWPEMPPGIIDRPAEIWEPLLAVADAAGGDWPVIARQACTVICSAENDTRVSLGIRLLGDLKIIFQDHTQLATKTVIEQLVNGNHIMGDTEGDRRLDDDAPWGDMYGGKEIDSRKLAKLLRPYGVRSVKIKVGTVPLQGYRIDELCGPWERYLAGSSPEAEPAEPAEPKSKSVAFMRPVGVREVPDICSGSGSSGSSAPAESLGAGDICPKCGGEGCDFCDDFFNPETAA